MNMAEDSGKKISILYILNVLRKYTDVNHTMTQQDIADKILDDYGMPLNRVQELFEWFPKREA